MIKGIKMKSFKTFITEADVNPNQEIAKAKVAIEKILKDAMTKMNKLDINGNRASDDIGDISLKIQYANKVWQDTIRILVSKGVTFNGISKNLTPTII